MDKIIIEGTLLNNFAKENCFMQRDHENDFSELRIREFLCRICVPKVQALVQYNPKEFVPREG